MNSIVVFDLDGVLADSRHRLHHILGPDGQRHFYPDWGAFYAQSEKDQPIMAGLDLLECLQEFHQVILLTGRSEPYRYMTEKWIRDWTHFFRDRKDGHIIMRPNDDHRPDYVFKGEALSILRETYHIVLVVDDSLAVIDEAVRRGFTCLHFRRPGEQEGWSAAKAHAEKVASGRRWEEVPG